MTSALQQKWKRPIHGPALVAPNKINFILALVLAGLISTTISSSSLAQDSSDSVDSPEPSANIQIDPLSNSFIAPDSTSNTEESNDDLFSEPEITEDSSDEPVADSDIINDNVIDPLEDEFAADDSDSTINDDDFIDSETSDNANTVDSPAVLPESLDLLNSPEIENEKNTVGEASNPAEATSGSLVTVEASKENNSPALKNSTDNYPIVESIQKNSLPASKYENDTREPVRMYHPEAQKGLTRITSDKKYIYGYQPSKQDKSLSVRFGLFAPKNLGNPDVPDITFESIYENTEAPIVLIDFDWKISEKFGRLLFQVGSGVYSASGQGKFKNKDPSIEAREKFTFITFPMTANIAYYLKYWPGQWLVPYGGAGAGVVGFTEIRDDDQGPKFGAAGIAQGYAGASLSLGAFSPGTRLTLDQDYGINDLSLTGEFRQWFALSDKFDFSGNIISLGFLVDY